MADTKVADYLKLRELRSQLEDKAAAIKAEENRIKQEILTGMDAMGMDAYKQDGYTVSRRTTQHVEIADPVVFYDTNFNEMARARNAGGLASDGMLFTKRVNSSNVLNLVRERMGLPLKADLDPNASEVQAQLTAMGARLVLTQDISIRKSSN